MLTDENLTDPRNKLTPTANHIHPPKGEDTLNQTHTLMGHFQHPVMTWANIHEDYAVPALSEPTSPEAEKEVYDAQVLDLRIYHSSGEIFEDSHVFKPTEKDDIPDPRAPGVYDFYFAYEPASQVKCHNRFHGIVVTPEGLYEPNLTAHAIYIARTAWFGTPAFEDTYIDRIFWCNDSNCFGVMVDA